MKKTYILLSLICIALLSSCANTEIVETEEVATLETKQEEPMAELTGNVVIDMNHALA